MEEPGQKICMPGGSHHGTKMTAGGEADDRDLIHVHTPFLCMLANEQDGLAVI